MSSIREEIENKLSAVLTAYEEGNADVSTLYETLCYIQNNLENMIGEENF